MQSAGYFYDVYTEIGEKCRHMSLFLTKLKIEQCLWMNSKATRKIHTGKVSSVFSGIEVTYCLWRVCTNVFLIVPWKVTFPKIRCIRRRAYCTVRGEIYERGKDKALRKSRALDLFAASPPARWQIRLSFSVYLSVRRGSNGERPMLIWFPCSAITTLIADVTHITRIPACVRSFSILHD